MLAVTFTSYPIPGGGTPNSIAAGPDGNLWYTIAPKNSPSEQVGKIGMINPTTGATKQYETPGVYLDATPGSIISGPGGDLWFVDTKDSTSVGYIGSIDPASGAIQEYPIAIVGTKPSGLALGSDGYLWFTDSGNAAIGVFNPTTHTSMEFPLPGTSRYITSGPDGNIWFTAALVPYSSYAIGDINPTSHLITLTQLSTPGQGDRDVAFPVSITAGPDGNVWFNLSENSFRYAVESISPLTHSITSYGGGTLGGITTGPDGHIWSEGPNDNGNPLTQLISVQPGPPSSLTIQELPTGIVPPVGGPTIVTGSDNNLWFTAKDYLVAAHIIPANQAAITGSLTDELLNDGRSYNPLPYHTVFIDLMGDSKLDAGDPTANTDTLGNYTFTGLAPGTYTVRAAPYPGTIETFAVGSQTVTVAGGEIGTIGQLAIIPSSSLLPLSYSPAPFGSSNPDLATAEVNGLYRTILGRDPDTEGGANAVAYLKGGGSLAQLSGDLLTSIEYDNNSIDSLYENYLGRGPSVAELTSGVSLLQGGGTQNQIAERIFNSAEFNHSYASEPAFVTQLYNDILGRSPQSSEVAGWVSRLDAGMTRSAVVIFFLNCIEADTRAVSGQYDIIWGNSIQLFGPGNDQLPSKYVDALRGGETQIDVAVSLFPNSFFSYRAGLTVR